MLVSVCEREGKRKKGRRRRVLPRRKEEEEEAVTVFEKIKKTVFFTRLSVFVIVILFEKKNFDSG